MRGTAPTASSFYPKSKIKSKVFTTCFLIANQMTVIADQGSVYEHKPSSPPDLSINRSLIHVATQRVVDAWDKELQNKTVISKCIF